MKIGIIGTGAIGSILARKFSKAGHQVKAPAVRDAIMDKFQQLKTFPSHEEMVNINRSAAAGNLKNA